MVRLTLFRSVALCIFFSLVGIDQLFKQKIRLSSGFFVCNTDSAWGLPFHAFLYWLLVVCITIAAVLIFLKKQHTYFLFLAAFFLAGTFSNALDRLFYGCVIDYLSLYNLPIFNLADVYISLVALLLTPLLLKKHS